MLEDGHATPQNLVAAFLAFGITQLIGHLERIDTHLIRSDMLVTKPLIFLAGPPLQLGTHVFRCAIEGHGDIALTNAEPVGKHISIIAQIEML